ncbi:TauD/TfdA family dioxygenase, partial [Rickettsiella grylli]|uniref:TauD/TfdA family dioxygenase n=1 Tax=Rickettsiella grylli TaxID=59196 RepID=UPI000AF1C79F
SLSKETLKVLQNFPVTIKVPHEFFKGKSCIEACIIDANCNIRFRREIIDLDSLTFKQLKAIEELENLIYLPQYSRKLTLKNDQILILNNKRFLHARTHVKDSRRHLQRIRFFRA